MSKKLSFRSVVALVIGSQIGSGVFLLPSSLAMLGPVSLFAWLISGAGAILLALVFAKLSMRFTQAGGPHVYVEKAFGRKPAFFTAWTYWLVSWVSSIAVIVAAVGYLAPLIGITNPFLLLLFKMAIFSFVTLVNIKGATVAGSFEFFLTILKCIPLIIIPVAALFALHIDHFSSPSASQSVFSILNTASLLTFWGFIGIETATTAGGIVDKPTKTIPRAVIFGTLIVAGIYFFNSFSIMGVVHPSQLANSAAPYVDAADVLFGPWGNVAIAIVAFVACVGTLNAWVLTSGQIAVQAAKDRLFPDFFAKSNKGGAPYASLLIAFFCTLILLVFTLHADLLSEINMVIDVSVTTFIFIYLASALALIKILRYKEHVHSIKPFIIPSLSVLFCLWILLFTPLRALLLSLLFTLSGLPVYLIQRRRIQRSLLQKD